jgi:hypothetical protein
MAPSGQLGLDGATGAHANSRSCQRCVNANRSVRSHCSGTNWDDNARAWRANSTKNGHRPRGCPAIGAFLLYEVSQLIGELALTEPLPELLDEIAQRVHILQQALIPRLYAGDVSIRAKLPFHVIQHREGLAWRCAELSDDALDAVRNNRWAAAALLVRAVVETVAACWYLKNKVAASLEVHSTSDLDTAVHRSVLGSRTSDVLPEAINVMTFVQTVDKDLDGFRNQFDRLCEYAHPNWAGTASLFSEANAAERAVIFGRNIGGVKHIETLCVVNLSVALGLFEVAYNSLADMQSELVQLCEAELGAS